MPPTTPAAARAGTAAAAAALPHDVLALICSFLPPGAAILTVPRLNKALAAAAARRTADLRAALAAVADRGWFGPGLALFSIPLWALRQAWPRLTEDQRRHAAVRAAFHGDLAVLRWALPQLDITYWSCCYAAAAGGQLAALQYARALGCSWDEWICRAAAGGGHMAVLQWARAQQPPCPWGEETCSAAAGGGHLAVLQWARAQDPPCPWDEKTCREAAGGGHLAVLQWVRAQHPPCPWDPNAWLEVAEDDAVIDWIFEQAALEGVEL